MARLAAPIGIKLSTDIEHRPNRASPYRARVRWSDPATKTRPSKSESFGTEDEANAWLTSLRRLADRGVTPLTATLPIEAYGESVMSLALRGLEKKTLDPYLAGWRKRVVPDLGHLPLSMWTPGVSDRAVHGWIADGYGMSTVKNTIGILVRIAEQAVRDGILDTNPARVTGWQAEYTQAQDELDDPRSLALPDWAALERLSDALVERSADKYKGWGDLVKFMASTAARIGEVSGVRRCDINRKTWMWRVCRQTTPGPGGLIDKGTKGNRARWVPLIEEIRPVVDRRFELTPDDPMARLFTGPRAGRVTTAVLRDATHWDEVVVACGLAHLVRHDLRHTGITWMADAGVPVHILRIIAGHANLATTQRYIHTDLRLIADAGGLLNRYLAGTWPSVDRDPQVARN
ncbi:tyrosine-type recombinase/integrase [Lentzea sp. NPDC054927]